MKAISQPKRVLLIFANSAVRTGLADAEALQELLQAESNKEQLDIIVDFTYARSLSYFVSNERSRIYDHRNKRDLRDYDFVYFRKAGTVMQQMLACASYLRQHGIPYFDREIGLNGSRNKLSQMFLLHEKGLPIPTTLYCRHRKRALRLVTKDFAKELPFPLIIKATGGSRGDSNYLAKSSQDMESIMESERRHFLIQKYIPNDGDYRALVVYNVLRGLIKRVGDSSSHLNNTSKDGQATWLPVREFNPTLASYADRSAQVCHRDIAGVDLVINKLTGEPAILEVNRAPQIERASFPDKKAHIVMKGIVEAINEPVVVPDANTAKFTVGNKEYVTIEEMPELGKLPVKIDTGAYSNSLHVAMVQEVVDEQGHKTLQYSSAAGSSAVHTTDTYFKRKVFSSNGIAEDRFVVTMHINLGNKRLVGQVGLTNRGSMRSPMLIGRRFLRQHGIVVDVSKRFIA